MTLTLFLTLSSLTILGYFFQKYIANLFVMYIYNLIPENTLPKKVNIIRKKGVEIGGASFFISIGISPISNLINLNIPDIHINQIVFTFTIYWLLFIGISSYILVLLTHYIKLLKK